MNPDLPHILPGRPRFRGRLHQAAFWVSWPAALVVVLMGRGATARLSGLVFGLSMVGLFGTSAAYHRGTWTQAMRARMQRLDHAMIFVLIAGSYTPIALLALRPGWGIAMVVLTWTLAVAGVTIALTRFSLMRRMGGVFYIGLGWLSVVALPMIVQSLTSPQILLLFGGGLLYTLGALAFYFKWPTLAPATFGYHEVWHSMTLAAAACHYLLVLQLVSS